MFTVTECERFFRFSTQFSLTRIPEQRIWEVPWMSCGRPAMSGSNRSKDRSSSGMALYLTASMGTAAVTIVAVAVGSNPRPLTPVRNQGDA
jgi:hypothetical protein